MFKNFRTIQFHPLSTACSAPLQAVAAQINAAEGARCPCVTAGWPCCGPSSVSQRVLSCTPSSPHPERLTGSGPSPTDHGEDDPEGTGQFFPLCCSPGLAVDASWALLHRSLVLGSPAHLTPVFKGSRQNFLKWCDLPRCSWLA